MFESIKLLSMSEKQAKRRFVVKNPKVFQNLHDQHKSILIYMAHMGNWDYFAIAPLLLPHQILAFYKPQKSAYINDLIIGERERFGVITIPSKKGYRALMNYAQKDIMTAVLLLGDQRPPPHSKGFWTMFLNQETAFLMGTERIAQKTRQAVVYPHVLKEKRGRYQVEFIPLLPEQETPGQGELIKAYARALEKNIREQPELWLWSHKRWKKARHPEEVLHA
jgi:KDO2-lipid IV(A) lauroyltransferase